jgi:hypothetical protein
MGPLAAFRYLAIFLILCEGLLVTFAGPMLLLWRYNRELPGQAI